MNLQTTLNVAHVISAAQGIERIARLLPGTGEVVYGTARRIVGGDTDILTACLEVTLDCGTEVAWNVGVLAQEVEGRTFIVRPDA
jgi:hypothetical protein